MSNFGILLKRKDSYTTPWPQIAESPWTWILSTLSSPWKYCLDLALPIATGFWAYKCEGLWTIVIFKSLSLYFLIILCEICEVTSSTTVKSSLGVSVFPLIFLNKFLGVYSRIFVSKLNLPLWGIPNTICSNPSWDDLSKIWFKATIVDSAPYPEYRLKVTNFLCKNRSKLSASTKILAS